MVPEQKRAWFVVGVFAVALAIALALLPFAGAGALAATGVFGLWGLTPLLFRKKRDSTEVPFDERDTMIVQKATLVAGMMSYVSFILACMAPWFVYMCRSKDWWYRSPTISIHVLPLIVLPGMIVLFVGRAIAILVLYGREANDAKN